MQIKPNNLHDEWHDPLGVQDVSTAIDYISELERGAVEAADYVEKQQQKIDSLREEVEHQRKKIADNDAVSEHDWQQQTKAYNALLVKRDEWKRRAMDTAEEVAYLIDHYQNGIKYDEKLNVQVCVWTKRQIDQAEKDAEEMMKKIRWVEEE